MKHQAHVHTSRDGRGQREVYLNGERLVRCNYANTKKGKVRVLRWPLKPDRWQKRIIERTLYGTVRVEFKR